MKKLIVAIVLVILLPAFAADDGRYYRRGNHVDYIPVNIDGRQGIVVYEFVAPRDATHARFATWNLTVSSVNLGIRIGGDGHFYAMYLPEWYIGLFEVQPGLPVEVIMSTNCYRPGTADLNIEPFFFDAELMADVAIRKIEDILEYLDDFNGAVHYAHLWESIMYPLFEPAEGPVLYFSLVEYCADMGMLYGISREELVSLASPEMLMPDGLGLALAFDMLLWLSGEGHSRLPHMWEALLTTNWSVARPLISRQTSHSLPPQPPLIP